MNSIANLIANPKTSLADCNNIIHLAEQRLGFGLNGDLAHSGEKLGMRVLSQLFPDTDTCIFDVGANTGNYSQMVVEYFEGKHNYHIHAFEPCAVSFEKYNNQHSSNSKIVVNNFALSHSLGSAELYMDQAGSVLASLTQRNISHFNINHGARQETVVLNTLDNYCNNRSISAIHFLKIDVEGHELDVLRGAKEMLASERIHLIQFEFGGTNIDTRVFFRDFWYLLKTNHYSILRYAPNDELVEISNYEESLERFKFCNYLAILDKSWLDLVSSYSVKIRNTYY